jgi:hypothetical protein
VRKSFFSCTPSLVPYHCHLPHYRRTLLEATLVAAVTFAKHIERTTIIVQREDGLSGDVDTVIVCMIQIMLDQQYRTVDGFFRLVEKEWFIFG